MHDNDSLDQFTVGLELELMVWAAPGLRQAYGEAHDEAPLSACRKIAGALREETGDRYCAPKTPKVGRYGFHVLSEPDIDPISFPEDSIAGVEIVTPPLPFSQASLAYERLLGAMDSSFGVYASKETGLHLGLSNGARIDGLAIALKIPEELILFANERDGRNGLAPLENGYGPALIKRFLADPLFALHGNWIRTRLPHGKRYATNLEKTYFGYCEFRHLGAAAAVERELTLDELVGPFAEAMSMSRDEEDSLLHAKAVEFAAAARWLRDVHDELEIVVQDTGLQGLRSWSVTRDGRQIATFSETINGATLHLAADCACQCAYSRSDIDFADLAATLTHMFLQDARFRLDWFDGDTVGAQHEVVDLMTRLTEARNDPASHPPTPEAPCLGFDFQPPEIPDMPPGAPEEAA